MIATIASPSFPADETTGDQQLLSRIISQGDQRAFVELVRRYSRTVWGGCRRLLRREQDAEVTPKLLAS
jgi:hypothetical protein